MLVSLASIDCVLYWSGDPPSVDFLARLNVKIYVSEHCVWLIYTVPDCRIQEPHFSISRPIQRRFPLPECSRLFLVWGFFREVTDSQDRPQRGLEQSSVLDNIR